MLHIVVTDDQDILAAGSSLAREFLSHLVEQSGSARRCSGTLRPCPIRSWGTGSMIFIDVPQNFWVYRGRFSFVEIRMLKEPP
jgi:hypothetical protein